MIWALIKKFGGCIVGILGVVLAALMLYKSGKSEGTKEAAVKDAERVKAETEKHVETVGVANETANVVSGLDGSAVTGKLRDKWTRD